MRIVGSARLLVALLLSSVLEELTKSLRLWEELPLCLAVEENYGSDMETEVVACERYNLNWSFFFDPLVNGLLLAFYIIKGDNQLYLAGWSFKCGIYGSWWQPTDQL